MSKESEKVNGNKFGLQELSAWIDYIVAASENIRFAYLASCISFPFSFDPSNQ